MRGAGGIGGGGGGEAAGGVGALGGGRGTEGDDDWVKTPAAHVFAAVWCAVSGVCGVWEKERLVVPLCRRVRHWWPSTSSSCGVGEGSERARVCVKELQSSVRTHVTSHFQSFVR